MEVEGESVERLEHGGLGAGKVEPELGVLVDPATQRHRVVEPRARLVEEPVEQVGHGRDRTAPQPVDRARPLRMARRDERFPARSTNRILATVERRPEPDLTDGAVLTRG